MKPTEKQLIAWWDTQQQTGDATCTYCGKVGSVHYVQPQHPYYAEGREGTYRCTDCVAKANVEARAARKAQLAAEPRCEVAGCSRRGSWRAMGVLLCGAHLKAAKREQARVAAPLGILGGLMTFGRDDIIHWAERG